MAKNNEALRNVSYGIGLQIFLGVGFIAFSLSGVQPPEFLIKPGMLGGMLIVLAINSMLYLNKYKKGLKETR